MPEERNFMSDTNPNCDGSHCRTSTGTIRVLPTGGDSNALLCFTCYLREMQYRRERNSPLAKPQLSDDAKFLLPPWESLKDYKP